MECLLYNFFMENIAGIDYKKALALPFRENYARNSFLVAVLLLVAQMAALYFKVKPFYLANIFDVFLLGYTINIARMELEAELLPWKANIWKSIKLGIKFNIIFWLFVLVLFFIPAKIFAPFVIIIAIATYYSYPVIGMSGAILAKTNSLKKALNIPEIHRLLWQIPSEITAVSVFSALFFYGFYKLYRIHFVYNPEHLPELNIIFLINLLAVLLIAYGYIVMSNLYAQSYKLAISKIQNPELYYTKAELEEQKQNAKIFKILAAVFVGLWLIALAYLATEIKNPKSPFYQKSSHKLTRIEK